MCGLMKIHCKLLTYILLPASSRSQKFRTKFFPGATRLACPLSFLKISALYLHSVLSRCVEKNSQEKNDKTGSDFYKIKNGVQHSIDNRSMLKDEKHFREFVFDLDLEIFQLA